MTFINIIKKIYADSTFYLYLNKLINNKKSAGRKPEISRISFCLNNLNAF